MPIRPVWGTEAGRFQGAAATSTRWQGDLICLNIFGFHGNIKQPCDKNVVHSYEN